MHELLKSTIYYTRRLPKISNIKKGLDEIKLYPTIREFSNATTLPDLSTCISVEYLCIYTFDCSDCLISHPIHCTNIHNDRVQTLPLGLQKQIIYVFI